MNPPHADWSLANNMAYLMFQSHYKRHGNHNDKVVWVPAPYKFNKYSSVDEILDEVGECDLYLMSSYIWNYELCDDFAISVKKRYPNAKTVLGGPQIGTHDSIFLLKRSRKYDFILKPTKPGEVFVQELIDSYIDNDGNANSSDISWELRSSKTCSQFMPEYSVYEDHIDYLKEMRQYAADSGIEPFMIIETTRGCPYKCTYCEWGGGTGTKIYKKPLEIVEKDILALKKTGFRDAYLTDANFGAFKDRDVAIFRMGWENGINLTDISTMKSPDLKRRIDLIDAWFDVVGAGPETHSEATTAKEVGHPLQIGTEFVEQEDTSWGPTNAAGHPLKRDPTVLLEKSESIWGRSSGNKPENLDLKVYISVVPTVSIQSVSDEAMKVAKRIDLSLEDKIKLSEHIRKRCHEEGYPVPALELILGMPGSTLDDFYTEMELIWNFKAWTSYRHDYMFLPDTELTDPEYLEKYNIKLVEIYSDLIDEHGVDNQHSLYKSKKTYFKTISSCYSFTFEDMCQMHLMNLAGNTLLLEFYEAVSDAVTPPEFGKICWEILKLCPEFDEIYSAIRDLLNPDTPPRNIKRINGVLRNMVIEDMIQANKLIIMNELFVRTL